jgi:hypothetical protein
MINTPSAPIPQRKRKARDLAHAITLRPRDIYDLYGIPQSTLCRLANLPDEKLRPPSKLIRGRGGRKGIRLFNRAEFEAWLARWSAEGEFANAKPKKAA